MREYIATYPIEWQVIACLFIITFIVQFYYYFVVVGRVVSHRHSKGNKKNSDTNPDQPPISVIVVIENDSEYLEKYLPLLLAQDYPDYEVVVVADGSCDEIIEGLAEISESYPRLKYTIIKHDPRFRHSEKLALTLGMKASRNQCLLFTHTSSYPVSSKWLSLMAKGFSGGSLVIGYAGLERKKGILNSFMRCEKFAFSVRYLAAATAGRAYRGIKQNLGYTKSEYFDSGGFTHLRLTTGSDDLFIQKIASPTNTSVILHPLATVKELQHGGIEWWFDKRSFNTYSFKFYPLKVRLPITLEFAFRTLFFALSLALVGFMIYSKRWIDLGVVMGIILLRLTLVLIQVNRCSKRVGDRGMIAFYPIYDFIAPASELIVNIIRRVKPSKWLWINR